LVTTLATGVVVVTLFSLALFWLHPATVVFTDAQARDSDCHIVVSPSGFDADENRAVRASEPPAVHKASLVRAWVGAEARVWPAIADYFVPGSRRRGETDRMTSPLPLSMGVLAERDGPVWGLEPEDVASRRQTAWAIIHLDRRSGLCVFTLVGEVRDEKQTAYTTLAEWYAGPEGFASDPSDGSLGRFVDLWVAGPTPGSKRWRFLAYDAGLARFFCLDLPGRSVTSGPEVPEEFEPVQFGRIGKNAHVIGGPEWSAAWMQEPVDYGSDEAARRQEESSGRLHHYYKGGQRLATWRAEHRVGTSPSVSGALVLGRDGSIRMLDGETLELGPPTGYMPRPPDLGGGAKAPPDQLLAYKVEQFEIDDEYVGYVAVSIGRNGKGIAAATFDPNNTYLHGARVEVDLWKAPGGVAQGLIDVLLVNLRPLALNVASYFAMPYVDAGAGARAVLLRPNSGVATRAQHRGRELGRIGGLFTALAILLPSILLSIALAHCVNVDGRRLGLGKPTRQLWILGTIAFGLPAYITYRLTRPTGSLVTCVNCGRLRWPDAEMCHFCGSPWRVPELNSPVWRVRDAETPPTESVVAEQEPEPSEPAKDAPAAE
jgi:hypothetical protein